MWWWFLFFNDDEEDSCFADSPMWFLYCILIVMLGFVCVMGWLCFDMMFK
jgi:flagellar biogenesis protein FliO